MAISIDGLTGKSQVIKEEADKHSSGNSTVTKTKEGAKTTAKKNKSKIQEEFITADAEFLPSPHIRQCELVNCTGLGNVYSGVYYTKKVTMTLDATSGLVVTAQLARVDVPPASSQPSRAKPVPPKTVVSKDNPKLQVITVSKGDTLSYLARKYGTTVDYLAKINGIKNKNLIVTGTTIRVPKGDR